MAIFADFVRQATVAHAESDAIIDPAWGRRLSFRDFADVAGEFQSLLREAGARPGSRVGLKLRNAYTWVCAEAAAAAGDFVTVPVNVLLSQREVARILEHSDANVLVTEPDEQIGLSCLTASNHPIIFQSLSREKPARSRLTSPGGIPHRIMYTSATTGMAKGVICPGEAVVGAVGTALANQLSDVSADDVFLAATPLTHMANGFFWSFFARGAACVVQQKFTPSSFCELIVEHGVTHTVLAPTMVSMVLEHLRHRKSSIDVLRESRLRALWYAGSTISRATAARAEEVFGPILNQQYGFTELLGAAPGMAATSLPAADHRRKRGSCGRPVVGLSVRVVDEAGQPAAVGQVGEIVVRSHWNGQYWQLADSSEAYRGKWIHSGDLGLVDDEGFFYITGRIKDVIISGGLNIYPREVEDVLAEHPKVSECAVVGIPDETWGEVPAAVVVTAGRVVTEGDLISFARDRLAHFKVPKTVRFVDALPLSATGKVAKRDMRRWLLETTTARK